MRLVSAGLSFRTAPLQVREAAAVPSDEAPRILRYLLGHAGLRGAAVMSTCNRTDFYMVCPDSVATDVAPRLARYLDPGGAGGVETHLESAEDAAAVRHMFRVASGLESMVIGEVQVLGQFKVAHRLAREAGTLDPYLDYVMRRAISAAKLVHTRTRIGRGAAGLSDVAVSVARDIVGDLDGRGVLLVGAGTMSTLAARRLREHGARIITTSRGESRHDLARQVGGEAVALDALAEIAGEVDVIIASTASRGPVLGAELIATMQRHRAHRPLCIVDIAVPRDVDAEAGGVPGVSLIDIDDLGRRLESVLDARRDAVPAAERILDDEVERTIAVAGRREASAPAIAALVAWAEEVRRGEVARSLGADCGDTVTREQVERLTESLVRKLMHGPVTHLREAAHDPAHALVLREAFRLDG